MQLDLTPEELEILLQLVGSAGTRGTEAMRQLIALEEKLLALRMTPGEEMPE